MFRSAARGVTIWLGTAYRALAVLGPAYGRLVRHGGDSLAAGIAFGMLLSMAPLLLVAVAVASLWIGDGSARDQMIDLVGQTLGRQGGHLAGQWIDDARAWSGTATALGFAGFVLGAARLVSIVDTAFDVVFEAPHRVLTFRQSVHAYFVAQATGIGVTLLASMILVASILLRAVSTSALGLAWPEPFGLGIGALRAIGSFALLALALGLVYRVLPPCRLARSDVVEGALVTAGLLDGTFWVLSLVIERIDVGAAYGAAGAVIAALVWLFVASELFLFGAEVTAERAERRAAREAARADRVRHDASAVAALRPIEDSALAPTHS